MMTEIDELEGKKLSEAVARALGMREETAGWWWNGDRSVFIGDDCPLIGEPAERFYNPHRDIAQAWELELERTRWTFEELREYVLAKADVVGYSPTYETKIFEAIAYWADFPTKSAAYATARCRAFLKAKAARTTARILSTVARRATRASTTRRLKSGGGSIRLAPAMAKGAMGWQRTRSGWLVRREVLLDRSIALLHRKAESLPCRYQSARWQIRLPPYRS